jgi:hypothetical protein
MQLLRTVRACKDAGRPVRRRRRRVAPFHGIINLRPSIESMRQEARALLLQQRPPLPVCPLPSPRWVVRSIARHPLLTVTRAAVRGGSHRYYTSRGPDARYGSSLSLSIGRPPSTSAGRFSAPSTIYDLSIYPQNQPRCWTRSTLINPEERALLATH